MHSPSHNFFIFVQIGIKIKRFFRRNESCLRDIYEIYTTLSPIPFWDDFLSHTRLPISIQVVLSEDKSFPVFQDPISPNAGYLTTRILLEISITNLITLLEILSVDGGRLDR